MDARRGRLSGDDLLKQVEQRPAQSVAGRQHGQAAADRMRSYSWAEVARSVAGVLGELVEDAAVEAGVDCSVVGGRSGSGTSG